MTRHASYSLFLAFALLVSACSTSKKTTMDNQMKETSQKANIDQSKTIEKATIVEKEAPKTMSTEMKPATEDRKKSIYVLLETDYGNMKIKLFNETPQHRDNFAKLVKEGFYDDLLFHRVINSFMVQGGDPNSRDAAPGARLGNGGPGYTIPAEFNDEFIHAKGMLSAARQGDQVNPMKASSGSQFYIVQGNVPADSMLDMVEQRRGFKYTDEQRAMYLELGGTPHLDREYTVFGQVVEGLDVIDKIAAVQTAPGDRPMKDIKMKMKIVK